MANLFVVFTPLQVDIAQQIIRQEKLSDNIMLESYLPNFPHFLDIYRMVMISSMWSNSIPFDQWPYWDYGGVKLLKNTIKIKKRAKEILRLLEDNNIDTIYLADYQSQTNRFSCVWLAAQGYKVVFFEEGYSHYIPRVGYPPSNSFMHAVYEKLLDWCYYMPIYHIKFAEWRCYPNKDYHGLPISTRYSIIPDIHHESYDKVLEYEPMASFELQKYIKEELSQSYKKKILMLTDPMTEILQPKYRFLYFETISDALSKYKDECIVIKFHPRDSGEDREKIINLIKRKGLNYLILGQRINIPVEFYLQNCHFEKILFFNTSTYFYNGYLFPISRFEKLLPMLYRKCKDNQVRNLEQMESILQFMGVLTYI